MKRLFVSASLVLFLVLVPTMALAATSTTSGITNKTQDLLDRVATKVAELAAKYRRTYQGEIKSLGIGTLTLATDDGEKTLSTNEATSYFKIRAGNKTEVAFKDLRAGDDISAVGTIDPATAEMTAREIIDKIERTTVIGTVTSINKTVYTIKTVEGNSLDIDLSDAFTLKKLASTGKITTAKMADFRSGSTVFVVAYVSGKTGDPLASLKAMVLSK